MSNPISWGADVPVSMPDQIDPDVKNSGIDIGGGYVMTEFGLRHKFSAADAEVFYQPAYAPLPTPEATS